MKFNSKSPSGKFVLRIPPSLHLALKKTARLRELSLNDLCIDLLSSSLISLNESVGEFLPLVELIKKELGDAFLGLVLFGSKARGDYHDNSDIDLLVVVSNQIPITRDLYRKLDSLDFALHFAHMPDSPLGTGSIWLECAVDGKVIVDPSQNIGKMLSKLRTLFAEGKVVRKETHGQWYWVSH